MTETKIDLPASNPDENKPAQRLSWDIGTAYDLFVSLAVLHSPEEYGLRASWAAGVRSRLPPAERKFLEEATQFIWVPMTWILGLPTPKDAATALWALRQLPPEGRLPVLFHNSETPENVESLLHEVAARGSWNEKDLSLLKELFWDEKHKNKLKEMTAMLDWWSRPGEFGEQYLTALQAYHQVFFEEEEKRLAPALKAGLEYAQELAGKLSRPKLLEELSQGVMFDQDFSVPDDLVLVPAYWNTPLILFNRLGPDRMMILFGARPADASLAPGELIPDALLSALKAMADPTRLRILRYLAAETLTPSDLARRLRLRAPTVTHHLGALRLAGLVRLTLQSGGEKRYTVRLEAIQAAFSSLKEFLDSGSDKPSE